MSYKKNPQTFDEMTKWQLLVSFLYSIYFHFIQFFWTYFMGYLLLLSAIFSLFFKRKTKKRIQYLFTRMWGGGLVFFGGIRYSIEISDKVDFRKTYLFISNHTSVLDIYLCQAMFPCFVNWMAKRSLFNVPFLGTSMWLLGHVPVYRDEDNLTQTMETLKLAAKRIQDGFSFCIFPEGTRSKDGSLLPFKKGAGAIARMTKVPVVPIIIKNANFFIPKGRLLLNPFVRVKLVVLDPIEYSDRNVLEHVRDAMLEKLKTL